MTKIDREAIRMKYNNRCAYCGCELAKGWHVDHLKAIYRDWGGVGCRKPQNETFDNLMPSCPSCNNYKNTMNLETFRQGVSLLVGRLNSTFTQYKIAKRFGLIKETGIEVKFYFELLTNGQNPEVCDTTGDAT